MQLPVANEYQLIKTDAELETLCQQLVNQTQLALDTEFIRRDTYFPKLALIQITWPQHPTAYLIDPLGLSQLHPLLEIFNHTHIVKIVHAGSEDLEIFFHLMGEHLPTTLDTQLANACLGGSLQVGYANLVKQAFEVELDSQFTCSDWLSRPLSAGQCQYAAADVTYLVPLFERLMGTIDQLNRRHWLEEEQQYVQKRISSTYSAEEAYMRIRHHWRLSPTGLARLQQLCIWRETKAQQDNKPRKHILEDAGLFVLADLNTPSSRAFGKLPQLPPKKIRLYQQEWLALFEQTDATTPLPVKSPLDKQHQWMLKPIKKLIQQQAHSLGIQPEFLMGKRYLNDLLRVLITNPDTPTSDWPNHLTGWRHQPIVVPIIDWIQQHA